MTVGDGAAGRVIVVAGPTAAGKSELALVVAERFGGTVVNADSIQLYRELSIITARPGKQALARAPHRLYGVLPAADRCSAGHWRDLAGREIDASHAAGRVPVVTGGTGLYLRALISGLSRMPPVPARIRAAKRDRLERIGGPAFHAELARRDPVMAARLSPGDSQRLIRAAEVLEATGRSLADWQLEPPSRTGPALRFAVILLMPPRETLYAACDARFDRMMAGGALEEARGFAALGLDDDLPAVKAVGLRPLIRLARGEIPEDEARALGQRETRRYAKRQTTWFRHQMSPSLRFEEKFSERLTGEIFPYISEFLLTEGP